jgi:hypothetical protein
MAKSSPDITGERRLAYEIRNKRDTILFALDNRDAHPSTARITDIRRELSVLQGMVWAYLYATEKWTHNTHLELTVYTNDMAMLWLSVDLLKMRNRAYGKPKTKSAQN